MAVQKQPLDILRGHLTTAFGSTAVLSASWKAAARRAGANRAPKPVFISPFNEKHWTYKSVIDHWLDQWDRREALTGIQGEAQLTQRGQAMLQALKQKKAAAGGKKRKRAKTPKQQLEYLASRVYEITGLHIRKDEWRTGSDGATNTWYRHDDLGKFYCITSNTPGKGVVATLKTLQAQARDRVTGKYNARVPGCKDGAEAERKSVVVTKSSDAEEEEQEEDDEEEAPAAKKRKTEAAAAAATPATATKAPAKTRSAASGPSSRKQQAQQHQTGAAAASHVHSAQPSTSHGPSAAPSTGLTPAAAGSADAAMASPSSPSSGDQPETELEATLAKLDRSRELVKKVRAKRNAAREARDAALGKLAELQSEAAAQADELKEARAAVERLTKRADAADKRVKAEKERATGLAEQLAVATSKLEQAQEQLRQLKSSDRPSQAAPAEAGAQATVNEAALAAARAEGREEAIEEARKAAKHAARKAAKKAARKTAKQSAGQAGSPASCAPGTAAGSGGAGAAAAPAVLPSTAEEWAAHMDALKRQKRVADETSARLLEDIKHAAAAWSRCD